MTNIPKEYTADCGKIYNFLTDVLGHEVDEAINHLIDDLGFDEDEVINCIAEELTEHERACFDYLRQFRNMSISAAMDNHEEVHIYMGTSRDWAEEYMNDTMDIPKNLQNYIDYEAFTRDALLNGDIAQIGQDMWVTNNWEF